MFSPGPVSERCWHSCNNRERTRPITLIAPGIQNSLIVFFPSLPLGYDFGAELPVSWSGFSWTHS
jgi:hypothetical protein